MTTDNKTLADVRNLIVCDTQFGWTGSTSLKMQEMLALQERGWVAEGAENLEFDLTEAGREVVSRALQSAVQPTLADAQPGGMVRLGDQAERAPWRSMDTCPRDGTVVRLRWGEDHVSPGWWSAPVSPVQNDDGTWPSDTGGFPWAFIDFNNGSAFVNHAVDTEYGPTHWAPYAALSAQPSPGGQGDARLPFEEWAEAHGFDVTKDRGIYNTLETRSAWEAWLHWQRLAARQPVYVQGSDELRARTEGERAAYMEGLEEGKKIAARQPVDTVKRNCPPPSWMFPEDERPPTPVGWSDTDWIAHLETATRQPVGEPVAWLLISEAGNAIGATRHARERESWEAAGGTTEPLYATPRVQNVDGYQAAFYELADMLGIPAQPCAPKVVWEAQMRPALQAAIAAQGPVPMVLHCPRCHLQHIDAPDERTAGWQNPPHRSHLCHGCGLIWRPADVPTVGVESAQTTGKNDTPFVPQLSTRPVACLLFDRNGVLRRTRPFTTDGQYVFDAGTLARLNEGNPQLAPFKAKLVYASPTTNPADLSGYRDAVMHAYGIVEPDEYCEKLGELLDLIDSQAVGK